MEEGTPPPPINEVDKDIEPKITIDNNNNDQTPERSPDNRRRYKRDSRDNRDYAGYKRDYEDRGWRRDPSPPVKRQRKGEREWDRDKRSYRGRGRHSYDDYNRRSPIHWKDNRELFDDQMVPFYQFVRELESNEDAEKVYAEYQQEYIKRKITHFFENHKHFDWFKEKYSPTFRFDKQQKNLARAEKYQQDFISRFNQGLIDWHLSDRDLTSEEQAMFEGNTVIVREIPPTCGRDDLLQFFKNHNLNIKHQYFEPVNENKRFQRNALITFGSADEVKEVITNLDDREVNKDYLLYVKATPSPIRPIKKCTPFISSTDSRIQQDLSLAKQLIDVYDSFYNLTRPSLFDNYTEAKDLLDISISYLRQVHLYCFYCGEEFDNELQMASRCGIIHLRGSGTDENDTFASQEWVNILDRKNNENLNLKKDKKVKEKDTSVIEQQTEEFYNNKIVQVDERKFRCSICAKLFKAREFVLKHINLKHKDLIDQIESKVIESQFFSNYESDPQRLPHIEIPENVKRRPSRPSGGYQPRGPHPNKRPSYNNNFREQPVAQKDPRALRDYEGVEGGELPAVDYRTQILLDDI